MKRIKELAAAVTFLVGATGMLSCTDTSSSPPKTRPRPTAATTPTAESPDSREIALSSPAFVSSYQELVRFDGRLVTFISRPSKHIEQHPSGLHDELDSTSNRPMHKAHTYVDIGEAQIVLTADEQLKCPGNMRVTGEVDVIDLGGPAGTKSSYSRVWVKVLRYECE